MLMGYRQHSSGSGYMSIHSIESKTFGLLRPIPRFRDMEGPEKVTLGSLVTLHNLVTSTTIKRGGAGKLQGMFNLRQNNAPSADGLYVRYNYYSNSIRYLRTVESALNDSQTMNRWSRF